MKKWLLIIFIIFSLNFVIATKTVEAVVGPSLPWWTENGEVTLGASTTTSVDLSQEVNTSKAFILLSRRADSNQDEPSDSGAYAQWVSGTRFNLIKDSSEAGAIYVWQVIEGNDIYVQNGTQTYTQAQTSFDITINSVDVSRTVVFMTFGSCDGTSTATTNEIFWTGNVTTSTNLHIQRDVSGVCDGSVAYFVVEFNDGSTIQQGEIANVGATSTPSYAIVNAINMSNTWLYFSSSYNSIAVGLDDTSIVARHYNTTAFELSRIGTAGTARVQWYAITTPATFIQNGTIAAATTNDVTISSVAVDRSFSVHSFDNTGSGTTFANAMGTTQITSTTNLHFQRATTSQTEDVSWQVIQFPEAAAPPSPNPSCGPTSPCCCYTTVGSGQRRCYSTGVCCAIGTPNEYWSPGSCYSATIVVTGPGIYAVSQKTPITVLITNNGAYADTYNLSYTIESGNPNLIILDTIGATTLTLGAGQTGTVVPYVTVLSTGVSGKIIVNVTSASDPTQWRTANITIIEGYLPFSLPEFSSVWIILIIILSGFAFYLKTVRKI